MINNKADNPKLSSISKKVSVISQILFILFIVIAVLPWFIPTSTFGSSILGIFGVQNYSSYNFYEVVNNFTALNRILGIIGSLVSLLPLLIGTLIVVKLSRNYITGNVFTIQNAKLYQILGIIYLCYAFLIRPISQMILSLCVTLNNPVGQRAIMFSFTIENLTAIFFAILLIVIGQVMKLGQKIKEEQEQFI